MTRIIASVFALALTTASFADIYQYSDCDSNGTLLLTELDAEPGVDLSGLYLDCAILPFADLTDADLSGAELNKAFLSSANLTGAKLDGAKLELAFLFFANLTEADLTNAILPYADLSGATLTKANLTGAILDTANLWGSNLPGANLEYANLMNANLIYTELANANLSNSVLNHANLSGADLTNANLTFANLTEANLEFADLTGANLEYANLRGANLKTVNLTNTSSWKSADWTYATYNALTVFPDGMNPEEYAMIYDDVIGACCVTSGCAQVSAEQCTDLGGTWLGEGGSCDDCPATVVGDLNGDGCVNGADLGILLGAWSICP